MGKNTKLEDKGIQDEDNWLPQLENGVMTIGDLWDAQSASRPGFNIFGKEFHNYSGNLDFIPIGKKSEAVTHNKETASTLLDLEMDAAITAELTGGFIKVSGGLEFQRLASQSFDNESVTWLYRLSTHSVEPFNTSKDFLREHVDPSVAARIRDGSIRASHYVLQLTLGADAMGSISIQQSNQSTKYRVKAILKGSIDLKVVSAELEASAELSQEVHVANYEKIIKLNCTPAIAPPVTLEDFAGLGKLMNAAVEKTIFYEEFEASKVKTITGVPKRFILLPIAELLDLEDAPTSVSVPRINHLLGHRSPAQGEEFIQVLYSLRDLEAPDYCKRLVLEEEPRLLKIISDAGHPITSAISVHEKDIRSKAKEIRQDIYTTYTEWKYDPDVWEAKMEGLLSEFNEEQLFDKELLNFKVGKWANEGRVLIGLVVIDEEDQTCPMQLFSNADDLEGWLRTERYVKIVLYTTTRAGLSRLGIHDEAEVNKIGHFPRALQKISKSLGNYETRVGIAYPSATATPEPMSPSPLTLLLKTRLGETKYEGSDQIEFVIHVLEGVAGYNEDGTKPSSLLYFQVYAEQLGISLPLPPPPAARGSLSPGVISMESRGMRMENLPEFIDFLANAHTTRALTRAGRGQLNISVYDDLSQFESAARTSADERWRFLALLDTTDSVRHSLHALELVGQQLSQLAGAGGGRRGKDFELAVCKSGTGSGFKGADSPFLFVFHGLQLKSICTDMLDVLVLLKGFSSDSGSRSLKSTPTLLDPASICLYSIVPRPRLEFARQLAERFGVTIPSFPHPNSPVHNADPDLGSYMRRIAVEFALKMARCILDEPVAQLESFPTTLVLITRQMFELTAPTTAVAFQALLDDSSTRWWDKSSDKVIPGEWSFMLNDLVGFLHVSYEFLSLLQSAFGLLNELAAEVDAGEDVADPLPGPEDPEPDPETNVVDLYPLLGAISAHTDCSPQLKEQITYFAPELPTHHIRVLATFLAHFVKVEIGSVLLQPQATPYIYFLQLLKLVDELLYKNAPSRSTQEDLVAQFILPLASPANATMYDPESQLEVSLALSSRSYYALVSALSSLSLTPIHHKLASGLAKMSSLTKHAALQVVKLLQAIWKHFHADQDQEGTNSGASEPTFLSYLWKNSRFVYLMEHHIKDVFVLNAILSFQCDKERGLIPTFIPKPFVAALKELMRGGASNFDFPTEWPTLTTAIEAFQIVWTRKRVPQSFAGCLLRNMLKEPEFKRELLEASPGQHLLWNEDLQLFEEPWDMELVYKIIDVDTNEVVQKPKSLSTSTPSHFFTPRNSPRPTRVEEAPHISTIFKIRQLDDQLESSGSKREVHQSLAAFFQRLQFGLPPFHVQDPTLGRFQILEAFVHWSSPSPSGPNSAGALREMASHLAAMGFAIPLIVPIPGVATSAQVLLPALTRLRLPFPACEDGSGCSNLKSFLFEDPFRMVTVLGVGQDRLRRDTAWLLNSFHLKKNMDTFTTTTASSSTIPDGYTEFCWLGNQVWGPNANSDFDPQQEMKLLVNVSGDARVQKCRSIAGWLQQFTSKTIVFWNCGDWPWSQFVQEREDLLQSVFGEQAQGGRRNVLEVVVNPSQEIAEALSVNPQNLRQIVYLDAEDAKSQAERVVTRVVTEAFGSGRRRGVTVRAELALPQLPPSLEYFQLGNSVKIAQELVSFVHSQTVKGIKSQFIVFDIDENGDLEAHWMTSPVYATAIKLFYNLLVSEMEDANENDNHALAEGLSCLEQSLGHLTSTSTETRLLLEQRATLQNLLCQEQDKDKRRELEAQLRRTCCKIEYEYTLSVPQLFEQLGHIYNSCPEFLEQNSMHTVRIPTLMTNGFLRGSPLDLPTSAANIIEDVLWYKEFIAAFVMSHSHPHLQNLFVLSFIGSNAESRRGTVIQQLFGAQKTMPVTSPHSSLRIRLAPLSDEFREQIYTASGSIFDALLLVDTPNLEEENSTSARALLSVLLASSHLTTVLIDNDSDSDEKDKSFMAGLLESAFLNQLTIPTGLPPPTPNILFITESEGGDEFDPSVILSKVESLASTYSLDIGIQRGFASTFKSVIKKSFLGELVYVNAEVPDVPLLYERVLREVLNVTTEHPPQSLSQWAEAVSRLWNHISNQDTADSAYEAIKFDLTTKLHRIGGVITRAMEFHVSGYEKFIYEEMLKSKPRPPPDSSEQPPEKSKRRSSARGFEDVVEDEVSPSLSRANILSWAVTQLDSVYQYCELGQGRPCVHCENIQTSESELQLEFGPFGDEYLDIIRKTLEGQLESARETALARVEQVTSCQELVVNQKDLLLEFEAAKLEMGRSDINLSWKQFLSTKIVLVGSWRRFCTEIKAVYPLGFVTHFEIAAHTPLQVTPEGISTQLAELERWPAHENGDRLSWELYQLLVEGLTPLAQRILKPTPSSSTGDAVEGSDLHYNFGQVLQLREAVTQVLKEVQDCGKDEAVGPLDPLFVWAVHFICLETLWMYVLKYEEEYWSPRGRFNPLNYDQQQYF